LFIQGRTSEPKNGGQGGYPFLMLRVADERRLPFDVNAPNAKMRKAIAELESGNGKWFAALTT